jgi:hypothetical protein
LFGESLTPTVALDDGGSTKRSFGGAGIMLHGGRLLGKNVGVGFVAELGGMSTAGYTSANVPGVNDTVSMTYVVLAPEVQIRGSGKVRPFGGLALGLYAQGVDAKLGQSAQSGGQRNEKGSSAAGIGLLQGGLQVDIGSFFFEGALFADIHGTGTSDSAGNRYFKETPVARGGLRLLLGLTF